MKKFWKTSATGVIVAVGLSAGHTTAQIQNDNSAISQATCEARLSHNERPKPEADKPDSSTDENNSKELSLDGWSDEALDLLSALNSSDFDEGTQSIVDCVGSSNTARVRTQSFELENFNRQANTRREWILSAEAINSDETVRRLVQLEPPLNYLWQMSGAGDRLIAVEELFYARGNDNFERFPRVRTTEVTRLEGTLVVTQLTTTNDLFDELVTWTLK